jgi:hypothetical protein
MNLCSSIRVIMFSVSNTPSHLCAVAERRHLHVAVVEQKIHVFHRRGVRQVALVVLQHVRGISAEVELQRFQIVRRF